jgi:tetratricopeptide (TPR) repeat protein
VVARFEVERQALAMMDHPNIAKVLDAGTTERPFTPSLSPDAEGEGARRAGEGVLGAGRPYFVMELVRGIKITDYCDQASLPTKDRLDLFIQVCHAIQHALSVSYCRNPNSWETVSNYAELGFAAEPLSHIDEAVQAWREAARIDPPGTGDVQYWLGVVLGDRKHYAEALPILRATQKFYPNGDRGREVSKRLVEAEAMVKGEKPQAGAPDHAFYSDELNAWVNVKRRAFAANPADTENAKHLATVYLWVGQTNEHQAICGKLLDVTASSKDPFDHERAAKAYLILAHPAPETLKKAVAAARKVQELSSSGYADAYFPITVAMAAVRDGKPAEAESLLAEVLKSMRFRESRALALAYRTLARVHLGRTKEARADFAELNGLMPAFPPAPICSAILLQPDSMAVWLAHDEARELLYPPTSPSKP